MRKGVRVQAFREREPPGFGPDEVLVQQREKKTEPLPIGKRHLGGEGRGE